MCSRCTWMPRRLRRANSAVFSSTASSRLVRSDPPYGHRNRQSADYDVDPQCAAAAPGCRGGCGERIRPYSRQRRLHVWSDLIRRTVTETDNLLITTLTHNVQPLHLDAEAAAASEFGRILVNGVFTFGPI